MARIIGLATLVAGALDILYAMMLTVLNGREIGNMLRFVASGPFPSATSMGEAGAVLGLVTHFVLMSIMAAAFVMAARSRPALVTKPIQWGLLYGVVTYVVMNWLVVPLRFDLPFPTKPMAIGSQLFAHIVLVGIPIALIAVRKPRTYATA